MSVNNNSKKFLDKSCNRTKSGNIIKNLPFSKKADIYYRLNRLVNKNQMGNLFKVMLITNNKTNFKTGL